jgi:hypothetical protein
LAKSLPDHLEAYASAPSRGGWIQRAQRNRK